MAAIRWTSAFLLLAVLFSAFVASAYGEDVEHSDDGVDVVVDEVQKAPKAEPEIKLNGPTFIEMYNTHQFVEPGWAITADSPDELIVSFDLQNELRQGFPGAYTVRYYLHHVDHPEEILARAERTVVVLPSDVCESKKPCLCANEGTCSCGTIAEHPFYQCKCIDGYVNSGPNNCRDVNECLEVSPDPCEQVANTDCQNRVPYFFCGCKPDFEKEKGRENDPLAPCVPINKCSDSELAKCGAIPNSYCRKCAPGENCEFVCPCNEGYHRVGDECVNINECVDVDANGRPLHDCNIVTEDCFDTEPFWKCICKDGYEHRKDYLHSERHLRPECVDINECLIGNDCDTNAICHNLPPPERYSCSCKEGFEDIGNARVGECRDTQKPTIKLHGGENFKIDLFTVFNEPGFEVFDNKDGPLFQSIRSPPQLGREIIFCNEYTVGYIVRDEDGNVATASRVVSVQEINQCEITEGPFRHLCRESDYARCVPNKGACKDESAPWPPVYYHCECPPGYAYENDERGCVDRVPPIFDKKLLDHEPIPVKQCTVCKQDMGVNATELALQPQKILAYDILPNGEKFPLLPELVHVEAIFDDQGRNCYKQLYRAMDAHGNTAEETVSICVIHEDLSDVIEDFKKWRAQTTSTLYTIMLFAAAVAFFLLGRYGSFVWSFLVVFFIERSPSWNDFSNAYTLYYRILHPFTPQGEIRRMVHNKYVAQQDS